MLQIQHDDSGKVTGVVYADKDGKQQVQKARVVARRRQLDREPAAAAELGLGQVPRRARQLLGQVGKNYMRHMTGSVYADLRQAGAHVSRHHHGRHHPRRGRHDPARGFVGGYEMETLSLGLPFMAAFLDPGAWGRDFTSALDGYDNMAGMWIVGEDMPQEKNGVTLHATEKDQFGLPVPNVHFDDHPNDIAMRNHAYKARARRSMTAVGANRVIETPPYPSTHNLGTNRMSENAQDGVVNKHGQTHDIKNLFISDGSQFTTGGGGESDADHRDAGDPPGRLHRRPDGQERDLTHGANASAWAGPTPLGVGRLFSLRRPGCLTGGTLW